MPSTASTGPVIDEVTIISLLTTVAMLGAAYYASLRLLPKTASAKIRILFIWHAFDSLIHCCLEGGFLYNCFFSYTTNSLLWAGKTASASAYLPPNVYFLGHSDRLYGSEYGKNPVSALWREYAKADARWGGSDLTVISLELLTVLIGGPLSSFICYAIVKNRKDTWFWMMVLATGELYGGFMTFAPEWLTGNPNLDCSNWMYLWLYLTFFNGLWVAIPLWILYEGRHQLTGASPAISVGKKQR